MEKLLNEIKKQVQEIEDELLKEKDKQNIHRLAAKMDIIIMRAQDAKKELAN